MAQRFPWSWKEIATVVILATIGFFILASDAAPPWLQTGIVALLLLAPILPLLALVPWHFVALHRGLITRSRTPCLIFTSENAIHVRRGRKSSSYPLRMIARVRFARNDNWTDSRMLEGAVGLFSHDGREVARVPESASGLDDLLEILKAHQIPVETVDVSAPSVLD